MKQNFKKCLAQTLIYEYILKTLIYLLTKIENVQKDKLMQVQYKFRGNM